jgi:hypothetical protein
MPPSPLGKQFVFSVVLFADFFKSLHDFADYLDDAG